MPQILTANLLLEGDVVFLAADDWSRTISEAQIADSKTEATALESRGRAAVDANLVVEPYLIDVESDDGLVTPVLLRERMRSLGPSVRTDLGKQAIVDGW